MWRPLRNCRQKLVQFNLWATLYGSWALGLFPFIFDSRKKKLRRSMWLVGYGVFLNAGLIWIAVCNHRETDSQAMREIFQRNPLAEQISVLQNALLLMTVFVIHFRCWWLSKELGTNLNILIHLHENHLNQYDSSECFNFYNYIIYKGLSIWLEITSMVVMEFWISPPLSLKFILGVLSTILLQLSVLFIGMQFHLVVIYIYRSIWIINRELLLFVNHLRIRHIGNSSSVHHLYCIYRRLLRLSTQLAAIFDYQMTLFMMSLLSVNFLSIFYMIVYSISLKKILSLGLVCNFLQAFAINFMDFWLNIAVFDLAERAGRGTSKILMLFNDIPELDVDIHRSINEFALFCSHSRLRFKHCGLFYVHNAMGFRMVVTCILYLLYLVQFDYMNL